MQAWLKYKVLIIIYTNSMTLEDFFTLTEMKNGLTTTARVEELISMIQKQKACATNHIGDAARQWSTVASTLASTENQDCLSHFVYLNGLCFFNQWLHEATKYRQVSDAEELINVLLGSLEKLPVDWKKLSVSGILTTIEKLLGHESADIKSRAQTLFEMWNNKKINDDVCEEIEKGCLNHADSTNHSADTASVDDKHGVNQNLDASGCETIVEEGSFRQESSMNTQIRYPVNNLQSDNTDKLPMEPFVAPVGITSSNAPVSMEAQVKDGDECIVSAHKNDDDMDTEMSTGLGDSYESGQRESLCVMSSTSPTASSSSKNPILAHSASFILESMEDKLNVLEPGETNHNCTRDGKIPVNESTLKACKEVDTSILGDHSRTSKLKVTEELDKKLDFELESGEFDALEVARLVAIEVEREVVDYREQSCSSSTNVSSRDIASSANSDIAKNKPDDQIIGEPNGNGSVAGKDDSDTATSPNNNSSKLSEAATELKTEMPRLESPNQSHKSSCKSMRLKCEFDLNADALSENLDVALHHNSSNPNNLSAPIAVSASKGAPEWAVTPLHFEGEAGWRGSAATSAFRPASPRRAPDCEKTNPSSKLKGNLIEIDLNVAESESDVAVDPSVLKELPGSYCIPFRDSSVEVSSGRAVRIQLDLNSVGDEETPSLQSSLLSHHHQKGSMSLSPTSSSSSMKPSMRNFDLNDNPIALDGISNSSITYGAKYSDPFFTIMGAKVPMVRRDQTIQAHQAWMASGLNWDSVMASRPLMPYTNQVLPPVYAYNGVGMMPAFPFQPAPYANSNIPHMAEARSTTIMPQLMGSSSTHGAPALSTQPFLMSISGTPSSSNVVEPSNPGLDLNREAGSLKQFFMPGRNNLLEEQIKTASQQSTSGTSLKRKEPDSGWEPFGFGYNQVTSWH